MRKFILLSIAFLMLSLPNRAQTADAVAGVAGLIAETRYEEAIVQASVALEADSGNLRLRVLKGRALALSYRYDEAILLLEKAWNKDSNNLSVLTELLNTCQAAGESDRAIQYGKQAVMRFPERPRFRIQLSMTYAANSDYRSAMAVLLPVYEKSPDDIFVLKQLANASFELRKNDSAALWLNRILALDSTNTFAAKKLANVMIRQKDHAGGLAFTTDFLKRDSANIAVMKLKAYFQYQLRDLEGALASFDHCIRLGDQSAFTYKYRGLCNYSKGEFGQAQADFGSAWRLDSTDAEIIFYQGVCEARWVFPLDGISHMNQALEMILPSRSFISIIHVEIAEAYNLLGKTDTALILMQKALEFNPANKATLFRIAYQYDYHLNNPAEALRYYTAFIESRFERKGEIQSGPNSVSYEDFARKRIQELKGK